MKHAGNLTDTHTGSAHRTFRSIHAINGIHAGRQYQIGLGFLIAHIEGEHDTQRLQRVRYFKEQCGILAERQIAEPTFATFALIILVHRLVLEKPRTVHGTVDAFQPVQQIAQVRRFVTFNIIGQIQIVESAEVANYLYSALSERVFEVLDFPKRSV